MPQNTVNNPAKNPDKINYKVDLSRCLKMRYYNNMTYQEIADTLTSEGTKVSKQSIQELITRFMRIFPAPEDIEAYRQNKEKIYEAIELEFARDMLDPERRKKASLNNTAYAFQQIFNANRLVKGESTANIDVHAQIKAIEDDPQYKEALRILQSGENRKAQGSIQASTGEGIC